MEFPYSINNLFRDEIQIIDNRLVPSRNAHGDSARILRDQMREVIDKMGKASGVAQGLNGPVTSASKMRTSDHRLYVMKEAEANNGLGVVVGLLKMGTKKLFIYDHNGGQHEMEPLCVLDFYIHESRQRLGCGKKLFEFMLKTERIKPQHLAIDNPSHKFRSFLQKHYKMKATVPQVNNFVVFEGFFRDRQDSTSRRGKLGRPPVHPHSKQAGSHLNGEQMNEKHQEGEQQEQVLSPSHGSYDRIHSSQNRSVSDRCVATPANRIANNPRDFGVLSDKEKRASNPSLSEQLSSMHIGSSKNDLEHDKEGILKDINLSRNNSSLLNHKGHSNSLLNGGTAAHSRNMSAQRSAYSRHNITEDSSHLQMRLPSEPGHDHSNNKAHINMDTGRVSPPILLRRDGPSKDYLKFREDLNNHMQYQDRHGHLRVSPSSLRATQSAHSSKTVAGASENSNSLQRNAYSGSVNSRPRSLHSTWNVMGVPPNYNSPSAQKKWQHTRLW